MWLGLFSCFLECGKWLKVISLCMVRWVIRWFFCCRIVSLWVRLLLGVVVIFMLFMLMLFVLGVISCVMIDSSVDFFVLFGLISVVMLFLGSISDILCSMVVWL